MPTITVNHSYPLDVPDYGTRLDISQIQDLVRRSGSHFFDRETMRFFRSRVDYHVAVGSDGWYFVTSEKHESPYLRINEPRKYTVRRLSINAEGTDLRLDEYENFQYFATLRGARNAADKCARHGTVYCPDCRFRLVLAVLHPRMVPGPCAECAERAQRRS